MDFIVETAIQAGKIIERFYLEGVTVQIKSDSSPLTEADLESHRFITAELRRRTPDIPILSEEADLPSCETRKAWERFWLVDPLDGTKEFLQRNGEFTVNIALIDRGVPRYGVIYAPAKHLLYFGSEKDGAWRQKGSEGRRRIYSHTPLPNEARRVVESRSHPSKELEAFLSKIHVKERIPVGSSLKFGYLADGTADLYPRLSPTMEWDVAAGDAIYRYSARTGVNPSPLTYNKPDLRNERFIIGL